MLHPNNCHLRCELKSLKFYERQKCLCHLQRSFFSSLLLSYISSAFHINYGKSSRDAYNLCVCAFPSSHFSFKEMPSICNPLHCSTNFHFKILYVYINAMKCLLLLIHFAFVCVCILIDNSFFISVWLFQLQISDLRVCTWAGTMNRMWNLFTLALIAWLIKCGK